MSTNYQRELDLALNQITSTGETPRLLLHSCCGPCSSHVLEYLSQYFSITVLYYNPNIYPESEYIKRAAEQQRLLEKMRFTNPVDLIPADYRPEVFDQAVQGYEAEPEGGKRCLKCFELRMDATAKLAKEHDYDYFTTTLSVSPHKDAQALNEIGKQLSEQYGVAYLFSDFKKKDGYKRSIELSELYGLYRQDYCGCRYSKRANPAALDESL